MKQQLPCDRLGSSISCVCIFLTARVDNGQTAKYQNSHNALKNFEKDYDNLDHFLKSYGEN